MKQHYHFSNRCYKHWVCFSSCQSKVNNPSHNELDSTKTSVEEVDSAAIIAQQKQKEAEKAAEAEKVQKQKEELERLAKNFKLQKDEFSDKLGFSLKTSQNTEIEMQHIATSRSITMR